MLIMYLSKLLQLNVGWVSDSVTHHL